MGRPPRGIGPVGVEPARRIDRRFLLSICESRPEEQAVGFGDEFRSFPGTDSGRKQEDTERRLADDGDQLTPPWFRRSDHGHKWLVVTPRTAWSDV
ncbi:hypothetical protein OPQ81_003766 [Rhizoctonia solani]|nr:hypothetical protein OPQ81_003766 [Rhizoctonia solani]